MRKCVDLDVCSRNQCFVHFVVSYLPRFICMCSTSRRKMAASISCRISLWPSSAFYGVSLPSYAGRRQPTASSDTDSMSSKCEGFRCYTYVYGFDKSFVNDLTGVSVFDRMFSLGIRGGGIDAAPLAGRAAVAAAAVNGPRRHFLYCTLKQDSNPKGRKSREQA